MRSADVLPVPGGPCSRSSRPAMSSRGRLHQAVHGVRHRRGVVGPHLVPGARRDLAGRAVRAAARGDVPEAHRDVLRLRFGLVRRAVRGLVEDLLRQLGAGRRHRDVGAPVPAGDQQRPAVALRQCGAAVVVPGDAQHPGAGRHQRRPGPYAVDVHRVGVRLLARREAAEEQRVDDVGRGVGVVDVEPDRQRLVRVHRHAAMIRHKARRVHPVSRCTRHVSPCAGQAPKRDTSRRACRVLRTMA